MKLRLECRRSAIVLVVMLLALSISRLGLRVGTIAAVLLVLSLLAHESGHILIATCLGVRVKAIGLFAFGAFIRREDSRRFGVEAAIAFAGPMINLVLALLFIGPTPLASFIATMNTYIFLANLLPIPGCDGWRVMHSLWQACFARPQYDARTRDSAGVHVQKSDAAGHWSNRCKTSPWRSSEECTRLP